MDNESVFVSMVCDQVAKIEKNMREMRAFYIFSDTRPGTDTERLTKDADDWVAYQKLFQF